MLRKNFSWEPALDEIQLRRLKIDCVVGIYPDEKVKTQSLFIDLTLFLNTREAAQTNSLTKSVDYAALRGEITFILQNARFQLLETAAEALAHYVLAPPATDKPRGTILGVELTITKPEAFGDDVAPAIKIKRHRSEVIGHYEEFDFGEAYVIHNSLDNCIYRMTIPAYQHSPYYNQTSPHYVAEMPVSAGLAANGRFLEAGVSLTYPEKVYRRYHNNTDKDRTILCIAPEGTVFNSDEASALACDTKHMPPAIIKSYYMPQRSQQYF
tara:strand:+ start:379 stop:1182 length:804 start_codon:yes stop_codon:yes gene_type:complete